MPLRPLNDFVIVEPDPIEIDDPEVRRIHNSGLLEIPEIAKSRLMKITPRGTIISWGSTCKYKYSVNDKVYFAQFAGSKLNYNDKEYRILLEADLIAKEES